MFEIVNSSAAMPMAFMNLSIWIISQNQTEKFWREASYPRLMLESYLIMSLSEVNQLQSPNIAGLIVGFLIRNEKNKTHFKLTMKNQQLLELIHLLTTLICS